MRHRLRFLIDDNPLNGVFHYRTGTPFKHLIPRGHQITVHGQGSGPMELDPKSIDVFWFNRGFIADKITVGDQMDQLFTSIREAGIRTMFDLDDAYAAVDPWSQFHEVSKGREASLTTIATKVDLLTCTTPILAGYLEKMTGRKAVVLPNMFDVSDWVQRPKKSNRLRIGFAGSLTHVSDFSEVMPALIELQETVDFTFVLFGFSLTDATEEAWYRRNSEGFAALNQGRWEDHPFGQEVDRFHAMWQKIKSREWVPAVATTEYPRMLASLDLDIGVCPLRDTEFARCKTDIKACEYALAGTTPLCQAIPPFTTPPDGVTCPWVTCSGEDEWLEQLLRLASSASLRKDVLDDSRRYVFDHRQIQDHVTRWEDAYLSMFNGAED